MCAAILSYTKDGGPLFQTQNVARRLVFYRPKRIGWKEKTSLHEHLWTYMRTFYQEEKKPSREFNYLKLPCPKFKRGRQTANVTTGHTYSETNVDLKLPNFERTRAVPSSKRKEAQNWGSIGLRWRDFSKLIEESNEDKIDAVKDCFGQPIWKSLEHDAYRLRVTVTYGLFPYQLPLSHKPSKQY